MRTSRAQITVALTTLIALGACASARTGEVSSSSLRAPSVRPDGAGGNADPTVRGARIFPEEVREDRSLGVEASGGVRGIVAGVRVVSFLNGAMVLADERFAQTPSSILAVPDRLGGGFLFVLGTTVWRADHWLSDARPIYASVYPIQRIFAGLDRVYVRMQNGSRPDGGGHQAIDARTGAPMDLGPWPASPYVGAYAAADGWRAVAITDLRGAVATFDAGATWRSLESLKNAKDVALVGDSILVNGPEAASVWFEVRADGQVSKIGSLPPAPAAIRDADSNGVRAGLFGKRPLAVALEDGWPLRDGTAIVAREGSLARVRLLDGALIDVIPNAYAPKPSRCHPVPLGSAKFPGDFGFVCGEVRGSTTVFSYDAARGQLVEQKRFLDPRVVVSSGNGALAVHGACETANDIPRTEKIEQHDYCLRNLDGRWHEIHVRGDVGNERIVVLADERVAILSPPNGDIAAGRLTILDKTKTKTVPLVFHAANADPKAPLAPDPARALRLGVWLDGFEERRPGVLGGWVEAGGSVLGLEISLDGEVAHGTYIHDAGKPMVSGRYGLGWSASRRGVETTDGGMTWTSIAVPEPIFATGRTEGTAMMSRACGPIGCNAAGWLRIGWGTNPAPPSPDFVPPPRAALPRANTLLKLTCEALAPPPPIRKMASPATSASVSPPSRKGAWGGATAVTPVTPPVVVSDLPPFYGVSPPSLHLDEQGFSGEATDSVEYHVRTGPLARFYAWGPKNEEWTHAGVGKWAARWVWPYSGSQEVEASLVASPPALSFDGAMFNRSASSGRGTYSYGVGDDARHALLVGKQAGSTGAEISVFELEKDRMPVLVRRADGEPFREIDASVRAAGHWFLATPPVSGGDPTDPRFTGTAAIVWQVDGGTARELVRIPRAGSDGRITSPRLARREGKRTIGFVIDGQPTAERAVPQRWVLPIDLETGTLGEPELLGAIDFADRSDGVLKGKLAGAKTDVPICTDDRPAWVLDAPWGVNAYLSIAGKDAGTMQSIYARMRLSNDYACIERITGTVDGLDQPERAALFARHGQATSAAIGPARATLPATVASDNARYPLRCVYR